MTKTTKDKYVRYLQSKSFKNTKNGYWYLLWGNSHNRNPYTKLVCLHRLLAQKYVSQPYRNCKWDVNHKDGNKDNNNISNLEWVTRSQNIKHAYKLGLRSPAWLGKTNEKHHQSIPIRGTHIETGEVIQFPSMAEARRNGFSAPHICNCIKGKRKTHKKYKWEKLALHTHDKNNPH